jgi:DNA-binding NarL/FixJ family response regulator
MLPPVPQFDSAATLGSPHAATLLRVAISAGDSAVRDDLVALLETLPGVAFSGLSDADLVVADGTRVFPRGIPALVLARTAAEAGEALAAGARGAIVRTSSPSRLHAALVAVAEGLTVTDDETQRPFAAVRTEETLAEPLTAREREVLTLLSGGMTNKEIASRLGITEHTVKFHVNAILGKLDAETRTEAVVHAAQLGIIVL